MIQGAAGAGSPPLGRSVGSTGTFDTVGVRVASCLLLPAWFGSALPSNRMLFLGVADTSLSFHASHRARKPLACHGNDRSGLLAGAALAASAAAYALVHEKLPGG